MTTTTSAPSARPHPSHTAQIADELKISSEQVERTLALLLEGATLPFIARYRKEVTGNLDEVQIAAIDERRLYLAELDARKQTICKEIESQGKLTDALKARILGVREKTELEDLYLPYKPKRRTRASIAREAGLEPLAEKMWGQGALSHGIGVQNEAAPFVGTRQDAEGKEVTVADAAAALAGARDIVAERIAELAEVRGALREQALRDGKFVSKVVPGKETEGAKFADYFDWNGPLDGLPSHRTLALRRGEKDGFLRVALEVDREAALGLVRHRVVTNQQSSWAGEIERALCDAYDRLLSSAIEVDVRLVSKERADVAAIGVFAENLRNLLLAAPLGGQRVLGVDPGFRTGCKVVVVDGKGDLLHHTVIYPTQSERRLEDAEAEVVRLAAHYKIDVVAIGNGTAGRETETFFRRLVAQKKLTAVRIIVVNEAGASVYSASEIARDEFPNEDITVRGAVSIARRLQDPLAELVKIDPKAIGVGQYQHDVNQPALKKQLDQVVESCVNKVGVELNTASVKLLQYVAGVGETLARNIVKFRAQEGPFRSRQQLLDVPRFGARAFEQAAGFLRIPGGDDPLDNSAVHPESYEVVSRMAADLGVDVKGLAGNKELVRKIDAHGYVDAAKGRGLPTLLDILQELEKPGRDPRAEFEEVGFDPNVTEFDHLVEGMVLRGVVTNVTQFGAFIDVGVHQDGLAHVSELAHRFIKDPAEVVKVGDRVKVRVLKVDRERRRIGLSVKQAAAPEPTAAAPQKQLANNENKDRQQQKS